MPAKYHIKTHPVPPRRPRIGKHGVVDWREDCARCHNCVKKACVYDRYKQEAEYIRNLHDVEALFFDCMGCFSCVQDCTKGLLCMSINPEYEKLGNRYWKPDIIKTKLLRGVGFSKGCAALALKNPPPLVPRCLIAIWEATGPTAMVCLAPSSVVAST